MLATVLAAKCRETKKNFGIRTEKRGKEWYCTWAFELDEKSISHEKYGETRVSGEIYTDPEYPGCPYCGAGGFYKCCKCGQVVCYKNGLTEAQCPSCGNVAGFAGSGPMELSGSGY